MHLHLLPTCLLGEIQCFLSPAAYASLVSTSKEHFRLIRYETVQFTLRKNVLEKFLTDELFRQLILSKIKDPHYQLAIVQNDMQSLKAISRDMLSYPVSYISLDAKSLHLLSSWPALLERVRRLNFIGNDFISDLSCLQSVERLTVQNFLLYQPSPMNRLLEVTLIDCQNVRDVRCLSNLKKIRIHNCNSLVDLEPIAQVPFLSITDCEGIEDISMLRNKHLIVQDCTTIEIGFHSRFSACHSSIEHLATDAIQSIEQLTALRNLRQLSLTFFKGQQLPLSSVFSRLHSLKICDNCPIVTLHGLENIAVLDVQSAKLRSLDLVRPHRIQSLTLRYCRSLTDFSSLQDIKRVVIVECLMFSDAKSLRGVAHVTISRCALLEDVAALSGTSSLSLNSCPKVNSLQGLGEVPSISIIKCVSLKLSLHGLGGRGQGRIVLDASPGYLSQPSNGFLLRDYQQQPDPADPAFFCFLRRHDSSA
jgi:hypothetical protein